MAILFFKTNGTLFKNEGFSVVVGWPKGFVSQPTQKQKFLYFFEDNLRLVALTISIIIVLAYYLILWNAVGRDPKKGTIIPIYEPPDNLSPAAMRYIREMKFDVKALSSALINMAVKGDIWIKEEEGISTDNVYDLVVKEDKKDAELTEEENEVYSELIRDEMTVRIDREAHDDIKKAIMAGEEVLSKKFKNKFFFTNSIYFIFGYILSVICTAFSMYICNDVSEEFREDGISVILVILIIWLAIKFFTLETKRLIVYIKIIISGEAGIYVYFRIFSDVIATALLVLTLKETFNIETRKFIVYFIFLVSLFILNFSFHHFLKAYTLRGRKVMDSIEGFKLFLSVAEKDRLNYIYSIEKTPELFEKYLPYALALDVEQEWADLFSDVFRKLSDTGINPSHWFISELGSGLDMSYFTSSFSWSFESCISRAISPPRISSGFGRGSGGGGGGGGGGGW